LLWAIENTGAERVMVTHGSVAVLVRYLREQGLDAQGFTTEYGDEEDDAAAKSEPAEEAAT
jgi:putative mRNA 3-end processing factor